MAGIALARLQEERKLWKQNHPFVRTSARARVREGTLELAVG